MPGLDAEQALLARLDNPERAYRVIHVAGTNGKGSVCALVASALRAAGRRVGFYSSPHLVRFNERIRIDGEPVGDEVVAGLLARIEVAATDVAAAQGRDPTFFECATAMAFEAFRDAGVDLAVVETGMGGRLDATNVVDPLLSVITAIGIEHTAFLGKDVESIAREKAGIVKPRRPVVIGAMNPAARAVIAAEARRAESLVIDAAEHVTVRVAERTLRHQAVTMSSEESAYGRMRLPLLGDHQVENAATALTALETFAAAAVTEITPAAIKAGFESVAWPARFQVLSEDPPLILDGAHNAHAAQVLARTLRQVLPDRPLGLVLGMCADKDARGFLAPFAGRLRKVWLVGLNDERSMPLSDLRRAMPRGNVGIEESRLEMALAGATRWAAETGGAICITGSLFLAGEVLARRGQ